MAAHDRAFSSISLSTYDVFLSFSGEDTRNNFTGFLHSALKREGINVFIDSDSLWGGEEIQTALLDAIQQSKISIPVFSKGYAKSKWCLMELVEINRCHGSNGQKVLPIFLDVEPRDVRGQEGSFEGLFQKHTEEKGKKGKKEKHAFKKHENKYDAQKLQSWRDALNEVAGKKGYELKQVNGNQAELVKLIVDWALSELSSNHLSDVKNPVGLDGRVEDVLSRLRLDSNDVRFVGICGIGGMGKTTIATALYNRIFKKFDMSCFLANVREEALSGPNGVVSLQQKLIYGVSKKEEKICSVDGGKQLIKEKLQRKKVLLILDDVDSYSHLKDLAIDSILFGPWSRIIITTRDEHILNAAKVDGDNIYWPTELDDKQSVKLFSLHAFSSDRPHEDYIQLSCDVIKLSGGLPLTLEVLGSSLFGIREKDVWQSMSQELKRIPHDDVYKKLRISYDKLNDNEKSIFLDAACLLNGWRKETLISFWDACGFNPILAIKKLTQMSLVKFIPNSFSDYDELRMHDQIQAMGRRIIYEESPTELRKRSRIWSYEEILEVVEEPQGAQMFEVINMTCDINQPLLYRRDFAMMSKLRLINVQRFEGGVSDFPHLPPNLKWLSWNRLIVPANYCHKKLVGMDLSESQIREAWTNKPQNENELFQKLKVLNLQRCEVSHESLDFSWFPYLERLDLRSCRNMVNLHKSIGDIKSLVELNLIDMEIEELPNSICSLSSLKVLGLQGCGSLKNLPESIGDLKSLLNLDLSRTQIKKIPSSICKLSCLESLLLNSCSSLKYLPESIGDLKSLVKLDLQNTTIERIPSSIGKLSCLKSLILNYCYSLKNLPESIGNLKPLVELDLEWTFIEKIPSSIGKLSCLESVTLKEGASLKNLPESIGNLKSLVELDLQWTKIKKIPSSIGKLSRLQFLNLKECSSLKNLPDSIGDLKSLVTLDLESTQIEEIPSSICKLSRLEVLILRGCSSLKNLPESIGDLKSLVNLDLERTKIEEIPSSICKLNCLQVLILQGCSSLKNLPDSIGDLKSLVKLDLGETKIKKVPDIASFSEKLEELIVRNCYNLVKLPKCEGIMWRLRIIDLIGTRISLSWDDSGILLPSLLGLKIGNNLESSLPPWISDLRQLQYIELVGYTKLESIPDLPSTLTSLTIVDCISLETLPDLSSLKHLRHLRFLRCEKLKEIRSLEETKSLEELKVFDCNNLTDTPKWKIHGQGTLFVDKMSLGNNCTLNVNDGIAKGLIFCVFFDLQGPHVQKGQLVDISLFIFASISHREHRMIRVTTKVVIKGVKYSSNRDIIYVHHFKGFDWFGIHLEPRIDVIQVSSVLGTINSDNKKHQSIGCEVKFWKVLLESTASEQQQQITNHDEKSITTTARRMVADFFNWSDDEENSNEMIDSHNELFNWADDFFNWSDDEDHGRSHHFVPTQQVGSSTRKTIHHFTSSSNALENEGSNPVIPQQGDEESSNEMIDSDNDIWSCDCV